MVGRPEVDTATVTFDHPAGRAPLSRWLLLLGAFVTSIYVALTAAGTGDYPNDAGPAMTALLHANLHAFASATPAMGELSLYLRLPFAALAYLGSPTEMSIYRWGAVPCVASVALLGVWLASIARSRGTGLVGQVAIVAVALFNPMVHSALLLGHPEELLTTSLAVGAIISAAQRRVILTTVLLGLAIASKQWAVIAVFPVVAVFPGRRVHVISGAAAIATAVSLPALLISAPTFLHNQLVLLHEHYLEPAWDSWLFLVSPRVTMPVGGGLTYTGPHLSSTVVGLLHPLIIGVAIAIGVYVARRARTHLTLDAWFAAIALAFLLRCALDTETMPYYEAPLFMTLLAWDTLQGGRLPLRALFAAAVSYALFDRLTPTDIGPNTASALYAAAALVGCLLLTRALRHSQPQDQPQAPAQQLVTGVLARQIRPG
jgi:hypothetical protein